MSVLLLFCATAAFSAPSLESYGKLEQANSVSISPNGELIAFRRTDSDDKDYIVVYSLKDKKQVTAVGVASINPIGHYFVTDNFIVLKGSQHVSVLGYRHDFDASTAYSFDIAKNKVDELVRLGKCLSV